MGMNMIRNLALTTLVALAPIAYSATTPPPKKPDHTPAKKVDKAKKKPAAVAPATTPAPKPADAKPKPATCPPDQSAKITEQASQLQALTTQNADLQRQLKEEQGKNDRLARELQEAKEQGLSGTFSFLITLLLLILGPVGLGFFVRKELEHFKGAGLQGGGLPTDIVKTGPVFDESSNPPKSKR